MSNVTTGPNRRTFLQLMGGGAAAIAFSGPLLAACSSGGAKTQGGAIAAEKSGLKLPTYKAFAGPKPDLPGSPAGLDPGYLSFPKSAINSVSAKPASGEPITALGWTDSAVPPPMGSNGFWQELNKRLGADFKFDITADYPTKFNTVIAGGEIPEMVWFPPNQGLTHVADLLEAKFLDLTPHLSGDNIAPYPNLANLGDFAWRTSVINGKIWGPAISHGAFGQILECNKTLWDGVGGSSASNADEFLDKLKQLTSPTAKRWAMEPIGAGHVRRFGDFFGVPNNWRLGSDGKLTYYIETDEYEAALEYTLKAAQAGVFHPDQNADPYEVLFPQGTIATLTDDMPGFLLATRKYKAVDPNFEISGVVPFHHDGTSGAKYDLGYGSLGFTAISNKVTDPDRVKQLLRVLDYFAAPFGSSEYLFLHYGVEGTHFNYDSSGNPQLTDKGKVETTLNNPIGYLSQGPEFNYQGPNPDQTKYIYEVQQKCLAMAVPNPTSGHYSQTQNNDSSRLPVVGDVITDILLGRKKLADLQTLRADWKSKGGDKIRAEYEASIAAAKE